MSYLIDCERKLFQNSTIDAEEYSRWGEYNAEAYADAKMVDRPPVRHAESAVTEMIEMSRLPPCDDAASGTSNVHF
jgi:hypothetical protein